MLKPLIRTLNGWRFELPLALTLGAATAFAMIAMPQELFFRLSGAPGAGLGRPLHVVLASLLGLLAGYVGYRAMKWPRRAAPVAVAEDEPEEEMPPIDVAVRLRRSDAHPDFPPREPIRASRDLGEPFMDIVGFADGPNAAASASARAAPIVDADYTEIPVTAAPAVAQPGAGSPEKIGPPAEPLLDVPAFEAQVAEQVTDHAPQPLDQPEEEPAIGHRHVEPDVAGDVTEPDHAPVAQPVAQLPLPPVEAAIEAEQLPSIAAFTPEPEIEPAPRPERAHRESLTEMMERLSAGLERRAGRPIAPPPADLLADVLRHPQATKPALRDALDELNRLAARRG